ncbi:MFS transporter [Acidaminobacter sp.]|uniref:MFS transporter n=1 Tax=Acidaminobacter sp. TaxID=1872102 RepID=UPI002ED5F005
MLRHFLKPYRGLPREIYVIFFSRMINAAGLFIFPLFTLILTSKIGLSASEAGIWLTLMGIVIVPANLLGGKLTDWVGRKPMILLGQTIGGILFMICGFLEPGMTQIYLILSACFFFGLSDPANLSIIADLTTKDQREAAYALSYMGFNLGFAIGPTIGGLLFNNFYAWIFWGDALTLFVSVALVQVFIKETYLKTRIDSEAISFPQIDQKTAESAEPAGDAMEAAVSGSVLKVLLQRPILLVFSSILLFYNFSYAQWHYLLPIQLEDLFPLKGASTFGLLASLNGLVVLICTPLLTSGLRQYPALRRVALGGLLYLIGFGTFAFAESRLLFALGCVIFTLGEITITISYMPYVANRTPVSHRGRMNAVLPLLMGVGYTAGPIVMSRGLLIFAPQTGWLLISVLLVFAVVSMLVLERYDARVGIREAGEL